VFVRPGATTGPGIGMLETTDSRLQADLSREQWYVYNENYGTSEEKALVKFVQGQVAALRERYTDIYLLRNQKLFQLYTFSDGRPVEPDFVLFLTERRTGKRLAYQLFVESKGAHLLADDLWKEQFLKQIEPEHRITVEFRDRDYRLVGMPLYNEDLTRREFDEKFQSVLLPRTEG
jgi:type III restriction enzyme